MNTFPQPRVCISGFAACLTGQAAYSDRMKKLVVVIALFLAALPLVHAQVTAEVVMNQEYFLLGESLPVAVRIANESGQKLMLGEDADWLTFSIERRGGSIVARNGDVPVQGEFSMESGQIATRRADLNPYFAIDRNGHYQITASVKLKAWNTTITTKPKSFDVINGAQIWSQDFGLPVPAGATNIAPEVRKYSLDQANYLSSKLVLYLRITDSDGSRVFKAIPIGPMVSISNPDHQIDRASNLHILYQHGARTYLYTVVTPDGEIILRQMHEIGEGRPKLVGDESGKFRVVGGLRLPTDADLPAPKPIELFDAPKKSQP